MVCQFWVCLLIFLLLGFTHCFVIQSCFCRYHRLNLRCGCVSTANWRAHWGAKQPWFFKEKTTSRGLLSLGRCGGGWPHIWEMLCAFLCVLVLGFSLPGTTTVPLYHSPAWFLWHVPFMYSARGGFRGEHEASGFGSCLVYLAPLKPSNSALPNLKGWRLCAFLTVRLLLVQFLLLSIDLSYTLKDLKLVRKLWFSAVLLWSFALFKHMM